MSEASERFRIEAGEGDRKRDAGLTTPSEIRRYDDIVYGPDEEWNVLDVYRPRYSFRKLPVIMIMHGGGWVYGCKELYQFYGMELARRGFAVVNYSYRLAPEVKFPAPLEDSARVMRWMTQNSEKYKLDLDNVFAVGDSAGGNLLGLMTAFLTDPEYAAHFSFRAPADFLLRGIALNCGAYRVFNFDKKDKDGKSTVDRPADREYMEDYLPDANDEKYQHLVNVTDHLNRNFPPAFIMSAYGDFLLPQAYLLAGAFREKGMPFELHIYGTKDKPLYHVFHCTVQEPEGQKCNDEECEFFRKLVQ